jgi:hypothetical protein
MVVDDGHLSIPPWQLHLTGSQIRWLPEYDRSSFLAVDLLANMFSTRNCHANLAKNLRRVHGASAKYQLIIQEFTLSGALPRRPGVSAGRE